MCMSNNFLGVCVNFSVRQLWSPRKSKCDKTMSGIQLIVCSRSNGRIAGDCYTFPGYNACVIVTALFEMPFVLIAGQISKCTQIRVSVNELAHYESARSSLNNHVIRRIDSGHFSASWCVNWRPLNSIGQHTITWANKDLLGVNVSPTAVANFPLNYFLYLSIYCTVDRISHVGRTGGLIRISG